MQSYWSNTKHIMVKQMGLATEGSNEICICMNTACAYRLGSRWSCLLFVMNAYTKAYNLKAQISKLSRKAQGLTAETAGSKPRLNNELTAWSHGAVRMCWHVSPSAARKYFNLKHPHIIHSFNNIIPQIPTVKFWVYGIIQYTLMKSCFS